MQLDNLRTKLTNLPDKDRNALQALVLFLFCCVLYAVFAFHQHANKTEQYAMASEQRLFWLRSQANNIVLTQDTTIESATEQLQELATRQNISLEVIKNDTAITFVATHDYAGVLGTFFETLEVEGFNIMAINMTKQPDGTIKAEASITL